MSIIPQHWYRQLVIVVGFCICLIVFYYLGDLGVSWIVALNLDFWPMMLLMLGLTVLLAAPLGLAYAYLEYHADEFVKLMAQRLAKRRMRNYMVQPKTPQMMVIPKNWDPNEVAIQLRSLQHNPSVARTFVSSVITRFVTGQDNQTAKKRIVFLKTKLEELTLSKELQASLDELECRELELDIKRTELEIKKASLDHKKKKQTELSEMQHTLEMLKVKVEIVALNKKIQDFDKPDSKPSSESPQDKRKQEEQQIRQMLDEYSKKEEEVRSSAANEEDKRKLLNIISKKKDGLYEELEKYI